MRRLALLSVLAACDGDIADAPGTPDAAEGVDANQLPPIPADTVPCEAPEHWPLVVRGGALPVQIHHRPGEELEAGQVLEHLGTAWQVEIDQLGFSPPPDDGGQCGDDGDFDVFLWQGSDAAYVEAFADIPSTAWGDQLVYMVIDPWGPYGGEILDTTVAHELNHAMQAADDWFDTPIAYEMTATFIEDVVFDDDDGYLEQLVDFQANPAWSLDRNDDYATWYMYGAAMYLHFVRDRYFAGDPAFVGTMWRGLRGDADFEDALDTLLPVPFLDSVVEFAAWRWFTNAFDDGAHFEEGAAFPAVSTAAVLVTFPADVAIEVMALGTAYVHVPNGGVTAAQVSLTGAAPEVTWVTQVIDGGRAIVVTALPMAADADPEDRTDTLYAATVHVEP